MDTVALFYALDKFAAAFEAAMRQRRVSDGGRRRNRPCGLHLSEVMTILVLFHDSDHRTFKHFYLRHVLLHLRGEFPRLPSYNRFIERAPEAFMALAGFLRTRPAPCSGVSFIDSTALRVCHNARIHSHKVMKGLAARGKTSTGWFYGFKLHLVVNDRGELIDLRFTAGNVDDRKPADALTADLFGKLVGDKGYIDKSLFERLFRRGVQLITRIRSNMKNSLMVLFDQLPLRKRAIVETIIDQLKNVCRIEHSRHRGVLNYFADVMAGLVAYTYRDKLPFLNLWPEKIRLLEENAI